ncbi:hypothetical protein [Candidatus Thioglobus sp.]|uniref:hypothetical protein n=1 Tax=Candidatus Thioglobus sp. TaxID=2026721 RepID=UPI0026035A98|nr:hypothetical protein [Candidatus Thioglobus sp.]
MGVQNLMIRLLLKSNLSKKLSNSQKSHLLSVLALSALSEKAFADAQLEIPETIEAKGYLVDLTTLLKEAGVSVNQIDEIISFAD